MATRAVAAVQSPAGLHRTLIRIRVLHRLRRVRRIVKVSIIAGPQQHRRQQRGGCGKNALSCYPTHDFPRKWFCLIALAIRAAHQELRIMIFANTDRLDRDLFPYHRSQPELESEILDAQEPCQDFVKLPPPDRELPEIHPKNPAHICKALLLRCIRDSCPAPGFV